MFKLETRLEKAFGGQTEAQMIWEVICNLLILRVRIYRGLTDD